MPAAAPAAMSGSMALLPRALPPCEAVPNSGALLAPQPSCPSPCPAPCPLGGLGADKAPLCSRAREVPAAWVGMMTRLLPAVVVAQVVLAVVVAQVVPAVVVAQVVSAVVVAQVAVEPGVDHGRFPIRILSSPLTGCTRCAPQVAVGKASNCTLVPGLALLALPPQGLDLGMGLQVAAAVDTSSSAPWAFVPGLELLALEL